MPAYFQISEEKRIIMRACSYCGQDVSNKATVCPKCKRPITAPDADAFPTLRTSRKAKAGAETEEARQAREQAEAERRAQEAMAPDDPVAELLTIETKQRTEAGDRHALAAAAYTGILFFIPLTACKNKEYGVFHANQGLVLLIAYLLGTGLTYLIGATQWGFTLCAAYFGGTFYLMVLGAVRGLRGKMTPLPIIGDIHLLKYKPQKAHGKQA